MGDLSSAIIFLLAAVIAVPIFTRFKLGAILGYLAAGVIIGPSVLALISDPDQILHVAELGVVFLLFIIGLELEPEKLLRMRNKILFIGGGQLLLTSVLIIGILLLFNMQWKIAVVIGLGLALSSTAFAIGLMTEKNILKTPLGQKGFSVLLMQDLAVIPILLIITALSGAQNPDAPAWWVTLLAVIAVLLTGRYLINPMLGVLSRYGGSEVMTAASLLIVIATAQVMYLAGLSMGLGAFLAGILLANSSFRHQLEVEISPFKGLLLGLFFIAVGMKLDLNLLVEQPLLIIGGCILLLLIKAVILSLLLSVNKQPGTHPIKVALMLAQGGEFAFVIFGTALNDGLLPLALADQLTLIVGLSMALTVPLVILYEKLQQGKAVFPEYDMQAEVTEPEVVIAGFGRFGQITGRILTANHIPFTALDNNAEHIEFIKQFGNKVFFGDATQLKLLKAAGLEHAKVMFIAADSDKHGFDIAKVVREHYPHIKIIARAKSRMSVLTYKEIGVYSSVREMFDGSLEAARMVLQEYGFDQARAENMVNVFKHHDEELLSQSYQDNQQLDMQAMIKLSKQGRAELESLFKHDIED
ncbi:monovalent cation:proton antiporter-2 (CPA2) family protein [Thalassomonas sp. M1454]|uniref:monovalent cation:proton antiporter-2 (CPA2) family protein n=1 Tax=Thalassomonas sp. M1454 TaxID=2594477 RepID=UPI00117E6D3E|nr:monovalent cation:proton antiporter-2 (CPA2) family protein [Thalassomonas sp. M1454]TRX58053.1 potassium transporter [Thalassomonas sp. M1454]